jgi:predicted transposase/invertase (TIGR01784 family)
MTLREHFKNQGKHEGRLEGRLEGKLEKEAEIIKRMLKEGFDVTVVSRITGLPIDKIKPLS